VILNLRVHLSLLVLPVPQVLPVLLGLPSLNEVLGLNPSLNQMQRLNPSPNPSPNPSLNGVPVQNIKINLVV
jgi:hypothetical protein